MFRGPTHSLRAVIAASLAACVATEAPHLVDGLQPRTETGDVQVVVEIPAGTLAKWEVSDETGALEWEWEDGVPRVVRYLAYPCNYGIVPRTIVAADEGGDGDPIDVLLLGASVERGSVVAARLVGVMEMLDGAERDDKLIAVAAGTPFEAVGSITELDARFPGVTTILRTWFEGYKGLDDDGRPRVTVSGFGSADRAAAVLDAAIADYVAHRVSDRIADSAITEGGDAAARPQAPDADTP